MFARQAINVGCFGKVGSRAGVGQNESRHALGGDAQHRHRDVSPERKTTKNEPVEACPVRRGEYRVGVRGE